MLPSPGRLVLLALSLTLLANSGCTRAFSGAGATTVDSGQQDGPRPEQPSDVDATVDGSLPDHGPDADISTDLPSSSDHGPVDLVPPKPDTSRTTPFARVVPGTSNIYGAGKTAPPLRGGGTSGTLPPGVVLPTGTSRVLRLTATSGAVSYGSGITANGPDGTSNTTSYAWSSFGGLAGLKVYGHGRALVAVFVGTATPTDPAPQPFDSLDGSAPTLAPGLHQIFFLGDGLTGTGSGARQTIVIPDTATRVFMGFSDGSGATGSAPSSYDDNSGQLEIAGVIVH